MAEAAQARPRLAEPHQLNWPATPGRRSSTASLLTTTIGADARHFEKCPPDTTHGGIEQSTTRPDGGAIHRSLTSGCWLANVSCPSLYLIGSAITSTHGRTTAPSSAAPPHPTVLFEVDVAVSPTFSTPQLRSHAAQRRRCLYQHRSRATPTRRYHPRPSPGPSTRLAAYPGRPAARDLIPVLGPRPRAPQSHGEQQNFVLDCHRPSLLVSCHDLDACTLLWPPTASRPRLRSHNSWPDPHKSACSKIFERRLNAHLPLYFLCRCLSTISLSEHGRPPCAWQFSQVQPCACPAPGRTWPAQRPGQSRRQRQRACCSGPRTPRYAAPDGPWHSVCSRSALPTRHAAWPSAFLPAAAARSASASAGAGPDDSLREPPSP